MDASSFDNIKRAVKAQHFEDEKLDALRTSLGFSNCCLSADQVAELVKEFPFDDARLKCVEICAPRLYGTTCDQAATILRIFSFDKSKTQGLEFIASHITDNNLIALEGAFTFQGDKQRAREILMNRTPVGPPPPEPPKQRGCPPLPGGYPTGPEPGSFPGMPPEPGPYPVPAPYPGAPTYPGQNPYQMPGSHGAPPGMYPYPGQGGVQYPTGNVPLPGGSQCPPQGGFP
ncbi:uncharacterized protein [Montipora capricornis]|uniref:uncharacterized protein n=1 Tax=Montipora capricornis TaxID=246305 RepID=UPI0035F17FA8